MDAATDMIAEPSGAGPFRDEPVDAVAPLSHRILVYAKGGRVRFISDATESDGVLVDAWSFDTAAQVQAFNRALGQILQSDVLAPGSDGWHHVASDLPTFLTNLFKAAQNAAWADPGLPGRLDLDERYQPPTALPDEMVSIVPAPTPPPAAAPSVVPASDATAQRQNWTLRRVAWFGFLVGLGWTAKRIARDELIKTSPDNVWRQAHRFGLSLSAAPQGQVSVDLPAATLAAIDKAAAMAHLQRDAFIKRLLIRAANDPGRFGLIVVST